MSKILGWRALTIDGEWISREQIRNRAETLFGSPQPVNSLYARLREFEVQLDTGTIHMGVDPTKGETASVFTRTRRSVNGAEPDADMPVFEIRQNPDRPDLFVRLYLHPTLGPVFTTRDLPC